MYSLLIDDSIEDKNAKYVNKSVDATISRSEYKDVLLHNKCLSHSMNRLQSKNHKKGAYELKRIYLLCFDDKIHMMS